MDTGCLHSLLPTTQSGHCNATEELTALNGSKVNVYGHEHLTVTLNLGREFTREFKIADGRGVDVKRMHCDFILTDVAHSETLAPPWMRITLHEQTVPRARRPSFIIVFVSQVYLGVDRRTFSVRSEAVVTTPLRILGGGNVAALPLHALLRNNRSSTVGLYKQRRTSFRSFFLPFLLCLW